MANLGKRLGDMAKAVQHSAYSTAAKVSEQGATRVASDAVMHSLIKKEEPGFYNAYLGMRPTKFATGLFAAGALGYGTYKSYSTARDAKATGGGITYGGPPPIFAGDGIQNTSSAPNLGANGSLVFGLNAMRRG